MTHSALMPLLETLPGWPEVAEPSVLDILGLTVAIPVAIAAVVAFLILGPAAHRRRQPGAGVERA